MSPSNLHARETLAYWRGRLYRNSYTRGGRLFRVQHWSVKVQVNGVRSTWTLAARDRDAAAAEALERFRARRQIRAEVPAAEDRSPLRLVQRSHVPRGALPAQLFFQLDTSDGPIYFPLGTADASTARLRAQRIQAEALPSPARAASKHPRECTLALEWSANPVVWTYFTLHTLPNWREVREARREPSVGLHPLSVAVVEPDAGLRHALVSALQAHDGLHCSGGFGTVASALAQLSRPPVSLVLVNHALDGLSGTGFLDRLRSVAPATDGITYSVYNDSNRLFAHTPGGSVAYLLKRTSAERCLEPILPALPSPKHPDRLARSALSWFQRVLGKSVTTTPTGDLSRLTTREHDILGLMSKGFLDKEIAQSLQISVWTVHGHAKRIFEKLKVHSRTEAAVRYLQK